MGTKYKGSRVELSALNAFINLMRSANSVDNVLTKTLAENGLTASQFGVIEALYHLGAMNQKTLASKLLVSPGNITMVIDNLEKQKYVSRKKDITDRRNTNIKLTKTGTNLIEEILPFHVKQIVNIFSVLDKSEQKQLREICRKLGMSIKTIQEKTDDKDKKK